MTEAGFLAGRLLASPYAARIWRSDLTGDQLWRSLEGHLSRRARDRRLFLGALSEACGMTEWRIYAYRLVRNPFSRKTLNFSGQA